MAELQRNDSAQHGKTLSAGGNLARGSSASGGESAPVCVGEQVGQAGTGGTDGQLFEHVPEVGPNFPILVPTINGRRGHPTLFPWKHAAEILRMQPGSGIESLVYDQTVREVPIADRGILFDLDTTAYFDRLRRVGSGNALVGTGSRRWIPVSPTK